MGLETHQQIASPLQQMEGGRCWGQACPQPSVGRVWCLAPSGLEGRDVQDSRTVSSRQ